MEKFKFRNKKKEQGYALLFVVVIISIISALTAGLANTTLKQSVLSSVAKDSQAAFFMSDTATECGFYAYYHDRDKIKKLKKDDTWNCGNSVLYFDGNDNNYTLRPGTEKNSEFDKTKPCFSIETTIKDNTTTIISRGYNFCNDKNPRFVERAIKATITTIPE